MRTTPLDAPFGARLHLETDAPLDAAERETFAEHGLLGLPRSVSDGGLEEVYEALYAPEQVYSHAWQPDDLVIRDDLTVQHARPAPRDGPRALRRYHVSETDLTADYLRVAREQALIGRLRTRRACTRRE